jgi:uracil-DNA glycosylase family 4
VKVTLDERRARLWRALRLGPRWIERGAAGPGLPDPVGSTQAKHAAAAEARPRATPAPSVIEAHVREPAAGAAASLATIDDRAAGIAAMDWPELQAAVASCTACGLCRTRTQTVFGVGLRSAHWMLVGEAPGAEEDARGEPFVGQAGRLLDNMLSAVDLSRTGAAPEAAVFIANVLKCRPPGNRNPEPGEVSRCEPFLRRQIALVSPRIVVVMGRFAVQALLRTDASIASLRGRVHRIDVDRREIPVVVTYHPAYLLRNLADKAKAWADLCLAHEVHSRAGGG